MWSVVVLLRCSLLFAHFLRFSSFPFLPFFFLSSFSPFFLSFPLFSLSLFSLPFLFSSFSSLLSFFLIVCLLAFGVSVCSGLLIFQMELSFDKRKIYKHWLIPTG